MYSSVLIDASTKWSHVCLVSTRNVVFARLFAQMTKLRAQFSDYPIKTIRLDNSGEFTSQNLNDYCMLIGINIEHHIVHVHTQNGLTESLIKRLQLILITADEDQITSIYLGTCYYVGCKSNKN